jgi:hypothetical protein
MYNPAKERRLKLGLFIIIGLINVSVFCIWIPARLQINSTFIQVNEIWDRIEKALFAAVDMAMNTYFMWLVKSKLVSSGLTQYNLVYKYNLAMVCLSVALDVGRLRTHISHISKSNLLTCHFPSDHAHRSYVIAGRRSVSIPLPQPTCGHAPTCR